ncbi:hypothetical protein LQW54_007260 [Pestalotiopsis sp. IQ-011]
MDLGNLDGGKLNQYVEKPPFGSLKTPETLQNIETKKDELLDCYRLNARNGEPRAKLSTPVPGPNPPFPLIDDLNKGHSAMRRNSP